MTGPIIATLRSIMILLLGTVLLQAAPASAQAVPEYELKAAFVYNFALFTEWPADVAFESGTLNICVTQGSALRRSFATLGDKAIRGRRVSVRDLSSPDTLRSCHVLFVDGNDRPQWMRIRKGLAGTSILTISDDEEIRQDGPVITLAMDNNRIVFDIDMRAARQARLVLSSKLLRLARTVQ